MTDDPDFEERLLAAKVPIDYLRVLTEEFVRREQIEQQEDSSSVPSDSR